MTVWLIVVIETLWMLGCAITGRYGHVRAGAGRLRSVIDTAMPEAITLFELESRARDASRTSGTAGQRRHDVGGI
jgi:uncharacterized membrane protein